MGRIIGGVLVGFIGAIVVSAILGIAMLFILGTPGIVEPETYAPTSVYLGITLALGVLAHYLGSAIARAIGKDPRTMYYYMGLVVVLSVIGIAMAGKQAPVPDSIPKASMDMSPFIASFYAQRSFPVWFAYASPVVALLGAYLGGMGKSEKPKPAATT